MGQDQDPVDGMLEWVTVGILLSSAILIGITISGATPGLQIYNGPNGPRWISSRPADGLQPFFWVLLVAAIVCVFFGANLALCEHVGSCHAKAIDARMPAQPGCCGDPQAMMRPGGQKCCCCISCEHFAFTVVQFAVMSLGVTAFLIVYMLCQNAPPPQNGAYLIAAAGAGMVIAGSIEFLLYLRMGAGGAGMQQPGMMGGGMGGMGGRMGGMGMGGGMPPMM